MMKKYLSLLLAALLTLSLAACGSGETAPEPSALPESAPTQAVYTPTAQWMLSQVPQPGFGSVGGEWLVLALARSEYPVSPELLESYFEDVASHTAQCGGVLHPKKYTEYSRVILAVTAIGKDPTDVGGFNLLEPLANFEQTAFQGINGVAFALLALDCGSYDIPENTAGTTQATREIYVDFLLNAESGEGGWSLSGGQAEPDVTAMVLQALSGYVSRPDVAAAVDRALGVLSAMQNENGGFTAYNTESSEAISQVIVALAQLGVGLEDERFVKNGHTLVDSLLRFRLPDGSFCHVLEGETDMLSTQQALYALVAAHRLEQGLPALYDMK